MADGFEEAKPYFDELSEKLNDERALARVHQILVTLFTSRSEYERAIKYGIAGLKLLGENLVGSPGPKIMGQLITIRLEMRKHDSNDFSSLPDMSDDKSAQSIEMLMTLSTPAFLQNKDLFVPISLRMFRITLRDGLTSDGLLSIHNYAITNYIAFKAIDTSYKSSENLFPLLDVRNISPMVRGRLIYTFAIVKAWHFRRYDDLEEMLTDGIRFNWQAADLLYVG